MSTISDQIPYQYLRKRSPQHDSATTTFHSVGELLNVLCRIHLETIHSILHWVKAASFAVYSTRFVANCKNK